MTKQKLSLVIYIIFIALVFNLERIGLAGGPLFRIHPTLYMALTLATLGTILIDALNRMPIYFYLIFWLIIYLAARSLVFQELPVFSGDNTFVTITELTILSIGVFFAYGVAVHQREFESFVEKVTMPTITPPVLGGRDADEQVRLEFIRSRRHNRPLALVVVEPIPGSIDAELKRSVQEIQRKMTQRFLVASLAQLISTEARRTDLVISRNENGRFVILCPETSSEGSLRLIERIQMVSMERLGISIVYGMASFPDEALTYDDLINKAEFQMQHYVPLPLSSRSISSGKPGGTLKE